MLKHSIGGMVPQAQKTESSALTGFDGDRAAASLIERYQQSLQILRGHGFCTYGEYPWDWWEKRALARGVPNELATLGRAVMREADQHLWEPQLQALCGWTDEGEAMIELALIGPGRAYFTWRKLLDTDGCRGCYHPKTGEWVSWL
jgi:hypothetical protein